MRLSTFLRKLSKYSRGLEKGSSERAFTQGILVDAKGGDYTGRIFYFLGREGREFTLNYNPEMIIKCRCGKEKTPVLADRYIGNLFACCFKKGEIYPVSVSDFSTTTH